MNRKIKNEQIFNEFSQIFKDIEASDKGRTQFFNQQSYGIFPENPDDYYLKLLDGKKWFDWQIQEYISLYLSDDWWGWYQIVEDYRGKEWMIPLLFPWRYKLGL
jgi:hypothetical protein